MLTVNLVNFQRYFITRVFKIVSSYGMQFIQFLTKIFQYIIKSHKKCRKYRAAIAFYETFESLKLLVQKYKLRQPQPKTILYALGIIIQVIILSIIFHFGKVQIDSKILFHNFLLSFIRLEHDFEKNYRIKETMRRLRQGSDIYYKDRGSLKIQLLNEKRGVVCSYLI